MRKLVLLISNLGFLGTTLGAKEEKASNEHCPLPPNLPPTQAILTYTYKVKISGKGKRHYTAVKTKGYRGGPTIGFNPLTQSFLASDGISDISKDIELTKPIMKQKVTKKTINKDGTYECIFKITDSMEKLFTLTFPNIPAEELVEWQEQLSYSVDKVTPMFYRAMWIEVLRVQPKNIAHVWDKDKEPPLPKLESYPCDVSSHWGVMCFAHSFQRVYRHTNRDKRVLMKAHPKIDDIAARFSAVLTFCLQHERGEVLHKFVGDMKDLDETYFPREGILLNAGNRDSFNQEKLWRTLFQVELTEKIKLLDPKRESLWESPDARVSFMNGLIGSVYNGISMLVEEYVTDVEMREEIREDMKLQMTHWYASYFPKFLKPQEIESGWVNQGGAELQFKDFIAATVVEQ